MSTTLTTYLTFGTNCREAMNFYKGIFGGELQIMTMGEAPDSDKQPPEAKDLVMHAYLKAPGFELMASDSMMGQTPKNGDSVTLTLGANSNEEAEKLFSALSAGGKVTMPLEETFWAHRFGMLTDKYGFPWMVSFNKPMM